MINYQNSMIKSIKVKILIETKVTIPTIKTDMIVSSNLAMLLKKTLLKFILNFFPLLLFLKVYNQYWEIAKQMQLK